MAAPTFIGVAGSAGAAGSDVITVPVTIEAGEQIIVCIGGAYIPFDTSYATVLAGTSVTDNGGNVYEARVVTTADPEVPAINVVEMAIFANNGAFCGAGFNGTYPMNSAAVATSMTVHLPFAYSLSGVVVLRYSGLLNLGSYGTSGINDYTSSGIPLTSVDISGGSPNFEGVIAALAIANSTSTFAATSGNLRGVYSRTGFRVVAMDNVRGSDSILGMSPGINCGFAYGSVFANRRSGKSQVSSCLASIKI